MSAPLNQTHFALLSSEMDMRDFAHPIGLGYPPFGVVRRNDRLTTGGGVAKNPTRSFYGVASTLQGFMHEAQ